MQNKMKNIIRIPIENLRTWRCDTWVRYDFESSSALLRIHYDLLIIAADDKVLESINFNGKVKGVLKDDILLLIINVAGQQIRKLKFKICANIRKYVQELRSCFPVVNYNSVASRNKITPNFIKIDDVLKRAFVEKATDECKSDKLTVPNDYKNFIKLCLLDPMFPQIVQETEKIINEQILGKK